MPRLVDNPAAPPAGTGSRLRTNGFSIDVRDLRPHDSALLDDLFARMSLQSRYLRFHAAVISLSETARASLLDVHERDHIALVAQVGGETIAIAQFIRDCRAPDVAEVAIAVADDWHRRGVGRHLFDRLTKRAAASGITRFIATVLPSNRAALGLFRSVFPDRITRPGDQVVDLEAHIDSAPCREITMHDVLVDLLS